MYPMYGRTDSHPHTRNQMFYGPYHTQSFEPVPPHIKMDPTRPAMFEPWPHVSSYGYSYPSTECHGCCNHNYFHGHYYRPPYPHFPPPSPHNYHGSFPPFFGAYSGYQIPPPHFSVEQPRYEYDKSFSKDQHCCGCSNHSCNKEINKNEKIEEGKTEIDKKSSGSLVPSHLRNFPFPFAMIPPDYLTDYDGRKSAKSEGKEDKKISHGTECDKSSKSFHEKETKSQQDIESQFPLPLFWFPYKPDEVEKEDPKGMNSGQQAVITPFHENNDEVKIPSSTTGPKMIGDGATKMTTPVKKVEHVEEKKKDEEKKIKAIPVVQADNNQDKGSAGNSAKKRVPSPKSSKLPPVCLRIDPPSKAKKVNGTSRSPSPPADGRSSRQSSNENSKSLGQNEQSQSQVEKRSIKVVEGTTEGKIEAQTNNHVPPSHEEVSSRKSGVEGVNDIVIYDVVGEATESENPMLEGQLVKKEEAKRVRKKMSDSEAATTIQSVYRGYEVRKSDPLKKLRQIAEITQKMLEVKSRISTLDACSDVEIDEKQLVAIGETIMGLLLKLDTIQGLHFSVRDMRKSVARELVSLQEKLDTLTTRKAQAPIVPPSEGPTAIVTDNVDVQSNQNGGEVVLDSTDVSGIDIDCQSGLESFEMEELMPAEDSGDNTSESPVVSSVGPQMPESDREIELEDQKHQVLDIDDGKVTTENEVSLELEVTESINLPEGILETTEAAGNVGPRDYSAVGDIKVDSAAENRNLDTEQLENVDGDEEKNKNAGTESHLGPEERHVEEAEDKEMSHTNKHEDVTDMEGNENQEVQTGEELSTPLQEKEATDDNGEDLKEANITMELVPPVVEERVDDGETKETFDITNIDGNDENVPILSEDSEKELPMFTNMVDQVDQLDGPGKVMEKGGEMVRGDDRKMMEENERLKEMMEKLIEAGNEQLATITKLSGKVKDLEKKLSKKGKLKTKKKPRGKRQYMVLV